MRIVLKAKCPYCEKMNTVSSQEGESQMCEHFHSGNFKTERLVFAKKTMLDGDNVEVIKE